MRLNATRLGSIASSRSFGNQLYDLAGQVPNFDLNFADTNTLDSRVTFTRASTGTYVGSNRLIQSAATNEARFDHNPTTGKSLGLLVEGAGTNLLYPSQFTSFATSASNNVWYETFTDLDVTPNVGIAPDGTTTAALVSCNATTNSRFITNRTVQTTAGTYSFTVFCKANSTDVNVRLFVAGDTAVVSNVRADFVLTENGTASSASVSGTAISAATPSIQSIGDGWYRCVIVATFIAPTNITCRIYPGSASAQTTASQTLVWGAQLETGLFPTSYIPTTSATVTRAADVASITGSNFSSWYNQTEGTVFINYAERAFSVIHAIASASNNTLSERISFITTASNLLDVLVVSSNIDTFAGDTPVLTAQEYRIGFGYKADNSGVSVNGSAITVDSSVILPTVSQLDIGARSGSSQILNSTIKRLTYWPTRLADTTLQQITQP